MKRNSRSGKEIPHFGPLDCRPVDYRNRPCTGTLYTSSLIASEPTSRAPLSEFMS